MAVATNPVHDELDDRADRIIHDSATYFAEAREQAREAVKEQMAREGR